MFIIRKFSRFAIFYHPILKRVLGLSQFQILFCVLQKSLMNLTIIRPCANSSVQAECVENSISLEEISND